jgi:hypothetical protein
MVKDTALDDVTVLSKSPGRDPKARHTAPGEAGLGGKASIGITGALGGTPAAEGMSDDLDEGPQSLTGGR